MAVTMPPRIQMKSSVDRSQSRVTPMTTLHMYSYVVGNVLNIQTKAHPAKPRKAKEGTKPKSYSIEIDLGLSAYANSRKVESYNVLPLLMTSILTRSDLQLRSNKRPLKQV
jgi:hypothetical protein